MITYWNQFNGVYIMVGSIIKLFLLCFMLHDSMNILFNNVEKKVIIQADDAHDNDWRHCLHFGFQTDYWHCLCCVVIEMRHLEKFSQTILTRRWSAKKGRKNASMNLPIEIANVSTLERIKEKILQFELYGYTSSSYGRPRPVV